MQDCGWSHTQTISDKHAMTVVMQDFWANSNTETEIKSEHAPAC